jgi:integrase
VTIDFAQEQLILAACVDYETITCKKKKSGKVYTQRIHCNRSHLRPLVIAALDTALRKSEMKKLDWKDVDLEKKIITIMYYTTKVPTTRKVPISTRLKEELEKFPHRKGLVFLHLGDNKKAWKTVLKRVGLPSDVRWHDLRHTGTTNLVDSGVAQAIAMKITGHTQNKTFNRYVNPNDMAIQNAGAKMEEHRLRHEQLLVDESSQAVN